MRTFLSAVVVSLTFTLSLAAPQASAQTADSAARLKIAPDLLTTVGSSVLPGVSWARLLNGELLVKTLVVSNSDDRTLTDLALLERRGVACGLTSFLDALRSTLVPMLMPDAAR